MILKTIATSFADFILLEEGIIIIRFTFEGELALNQGMEIFRITVELSAGKKHSLIYDFNHNNIIFSQEIKQGAQSRNPLDDLLASRSFICYSLSNKLEVNHFIKFNKPSSPTQLFNSLDDAIAWSKLKLN